jgi:hypothetical protein
MITRSASARAPPQRDVEHLRAADDGVGIHAPSPVIMPTLTGPKMSQRAKNFSETRALIGAV